jgi:hypothetical protein
MHIPFKIRIKWIRFKSWLFDLLSLEPERPFIDRDQSRLGGLLILFVLLMSACGSIQIGVEPTANQQLEPPTTVAPTIAPETSVTDPAPSKPTVEAPGPDLYWVPYAVAVGGAEGAIIVDEGVVGFSESPVSFQLFYDYSPVSGRIAYGSEFWHAAQGSSIAVSDLWVYDFARNAETQLLDDNVGRALFSPPTSSGPVQLAAVVFNPDLLTFELALVGADGSLELLTSCASPSFSWSPDGSMIAYEAWSDPDAGSPSGSCQGVFVYSFKDGTTTKLADQPPSTGGWHGDQPIWAEGQDALLLTYASPESVFAVVPLDGSGVYVVEKSDSIPVEYLPNPMLSLWSEPYNSIIGQTEGMMDPFGVWVYQFSQDMRTVEGAYRIKIDGRDLDLQLIGWWQPGESVLLRETTNLSELNRFGRGIVWSLGDQTWHEIPDNVPEIEVKLHDADTRTGVPVVDNTIEAFLAGDRAQRRELLELVSAECVEDDYGVGPPRCPEGTPTGTLLEVFPYQLYRESEFASGDELDGILDFQIKGLYAVQPLRDGFDESWWPRGEYNIVFASGENDNAIAVITDQGGNVVRIEFSELTPVELLYGYSGEYILAPPS